MATKRNLTRLLFVAILPLLSGPALAGGSEPKQVTGELSVVDGVRVLRLWGTLSKQGFAQGYLIGQDVVDLWDGFLSSGAVGGSPQGYEEAVLPKLGIMVIAPRYEAELRGILAGLEARAGGPVQLPSVGRAFRYEDLVAANCVPDLSRLGCSSFAAWGSMTKGGKTLAGRNMDWYPIPALAGTQIIVARAAPPDSDRLGWVSVTWPGVIGCLTGMNSEGVSIATHDARGFKPTTATGYTPYILTFRDAIESAKAATAFADVAQVLRKRACTVGNNMMVTRPYTGAGPAAAVFEFDGDHTHTNGVTERLPDANVPYLACTNHYRKRTPPVTCGRFAKIDSVLASTLQDAQQYLDRETAWTLLDSVAIAEIATHHSVVFEPNASLMHVALMTDGKPAPQCRPAALNVSELIPGARSAAHSARKGKHVPD